MTTDITARLTVIAMALLAFAAWLLQHPFLGLGHDSTFYTLFALAKLHPDTLSADVFLRFGSQDRYTLFTPLYSGAISLLGLEPAAAALTLATHVALLSGAWLVARHFMAALQATLAVALLVALPGEYGSENYFHYLEGFLTPRLPAEALVLIAVAATLGRRYWLAGVCLLTAMLLHPVMAVAGVAFIVLTFVAPTHPRLTASAIVTLLVSSLVVVTATAPLGRIDAVWLEIVRASSPYLYVSSWSIRDWSRVVVPLAVLAIGLLTGIAPLLRRMCGGALVLVACGLVLNLIYCDLLHVVIFTDLQAWRWLWLADVLAVVLIPVIAGDCWCSGTAGRVAIILLATAWVIRDDGAALYIVPIAIACAAAPAQWRNHRYARLVLLGSCVLLVIATTSDLSSRLAYPEARDTTAARFPQELRSVCADGVIPAVLLIATWFALQRIRSTQAHWALAVTGAVVCTPLLWLNWSAWTQVHYTTESARKFAPWRAEIPVNAEVMWPDTPLGAWYLLERPSYWSAHQASVGAIFSRDKALLMRQRTASINAALRDGGLVRNDTPEAPPGLATPTSAARMNARSVLRACADPALRYVASWLKLGNTPVAPVTPDLAKPGSRLYLYRCADFTS